MKGDSGVVPRITIILTTYNGENYLREQLDSILGQTLRDFELLVGDDVSSDGTLAILSEYALLDQRIQFSANTVNLGVTKNIESLLCKASGQFIAIADQDDIWYPQKLEIMLRELGSASAVYCDSLLIDKNGEDLGKTLLQRIDVVQPVSGCNPVQLLNRNCVSGHALLLHRKLLSFALPLSPGLMFDHQLALSAAAQHGLKYFPEVLLMHRMHDHNLNNRLFHQEAMRVSRVERFARRRQSLLVAILYLLGRPGAEVMSNTSALNIKILRLISEELSGNPRRNYYLLFLLLLVRKQLFHLDLAKSWRYCRMYAGFGGD